MRRTPTVYQSGERDASHKLPCSFLSVSSQPVSIRLTSLSCQGERGCLALPAALRRSEWRMVWWSCRREPRKTESTPGPQVHDSIDGDVLHPGNKKPRRRRQYIYVEVVSIRAFHRPPSSFLLPSSFHRRRRPHHCKRGVGCYRHHDLHTYHHRKGGCKELRRGRPGNTPGRAPKNSRHLSSLPRDILTMQYILLHVCQSFIYFPVYSRLCATGVHIIQFILMHSRICVYGLHLALQVCNMLC